MSSVVLAVFGFSTIAAYTDPAIGPKMEKAP